MESAREATPADLATLISLAERMRAELAGERGGPLWALRDAPADPAEHFGRLLTDASARVVVGLIDRVPIGYATLVIERLRDGSLLGVVEELYTEPDARAVGVGEAMLGDLVDFCLSAGCVGIDGTALPGHREAKNFFERAGFTARRLVMHRDLGRDPGTGSGTNPR